MRKAWIFIIVLIGCNWSDAQSYTNFSEKDGLPSNHVYKITQDVNGFIWIATDEGLVKYNGSEFKVFTTKDGLPTNDIWNMFPATDGKIWYMSKSASLGYILEDVVYDFKNENVNESLNPIYTGFTGKEVIINSDNKAHVLSENNKWEKMLFKNVKDRNAIYGLKHHTFCYIVTAKDNSLLLRTKTNEDIVVPNSYIGDNSYYRAQVTDSLYFTITNKTYSILNLNTVENNVYSFENEMGINAPSYGRIHIVNNELQFTSEHFVAKLDAAFRLKNVTKIPETLQSHYSFIDRENTVWIATFSNGIYKYVENESLIRKELDGFKINNLAMVRNRLIACVAGKGFYEYDAVLNKFVPFIEDDSYLYSVSYIPETKTEYYLSKKHIHTNINRGMNTLDFKIANDVARSLTYFNGYLFAHRTNGFNKLESASLEIVDGYELSGTSSIKSFKNRLILGVSNGLFELKDEQISPVKLITSFNKPVVDLLPLNTVSMLVTTNGYGIYITDLKTITLLEGSEFLKCTNPFFKDNNLFLPTNKGIYYYTVQNKSLRFKKRWNKTNGLPTNKINGLALRDDNLVVATNSGILHFPLDYKSAQNILDIYIDEITYNNDDLKINNTHLYKGGSDVQFMIKNIDFRNNQSLSYKYRLLPTQNIWKESSASDLNFSDLRPRKYELQLQQGSIIKSFSFTIKPRWWQHWLFSLLCAILVILLIIYITKVLLNRAETIRMKELIQSKKLSELQLKALRSQMNPHFVFNSLNAIQYYINENDFETSDTYLVKFSRLVREFFELSKEQYITVKREISLLKNYLDLECFRFKGKLTYEFEIDPTLDLKDKLPSMLLQPIVENAVNHGIFNKKTNGKVALHFKRISENELVIIITDDGIGYIQKKEDERYKSSSVLDDRLKYLKESGNWDIQVTNQKAFPNKLNPGHKVTFTIKRLTNETL